MRENIKECERSEGQKVRKREVHEPVDASRTDDDLKQDRAAEK